MDYKIYENVLSDEFIDDIFININEYRFHQGKVGNRVNLKQKRRKDLFIDNNKLLQTIDNKIYKTQYKDIYNNFSNINYREIWKLGYYKAEDQGFYNIHTDTAGDTKYRKTSFVAMLSDPSEYEGGEFYFRDLYIEINLNKGDILVFNSKLFH